MTGVEVITVVVSAPFPSLILDLYRIFRLSPEIHAVQKHCKILNTNLSILGVHNLIWIVASQSGDRSKSLLGEVF